MAKRKDPAAVALGRKGGKTRAKTLSAKELSEQGKKAAEARWATRGMVARERVVTVVTGDELEASATKPKKAKKATTAQRGKTKK